MLDSRVRTALNDYQQGRRDLESAAQLLAQVRREPGCLALHASPSAGAAERALLARFTELAAADGDGQAPSGPPVVRSPEHTAVSASEVELLAEADVRPRVRIPDLPPTRRRAVGG